MTDYQTIKDLAKSQQGISVKDLCALAPGNDPFYTGRPAEVSQAHHDLTEVLHQAADIRTRLDLVTRYLTAALRAAKGGGNRGD